MSSLNTNAAAMTALQSLRMTNAAMAHTQSAISTGLRVGSAKDNSAYWSIATTMRSDNKAMSTVQDALGLGAATVDVAYTALETAIKTADEIKAKIVAALEPGVDKIKVQAEIDELQSQLSQIATAASFTGENWLAVNSTAADFSLSKSIVSSFTRVGNNISIGTTDVDLSGVFLFDAATDPTRTGIIDEIRTVGGTTSTTVVTVSSLTIATLTDSAADVIILGDYAQAVDDVIREMTAAATILGATASRVELQKEFVTNLMDAIDRGIGQLVDADMNAESVRLQALQTQQQLGIQALSIANGLGQNILALFRN